MKKGFTLIEMMISIVLFSVILVFLYQVLETTKNHNVKYDKQIDKRLNQYEIEFAIFLDIVNKYPTKVVIKEDKNSNTILQLQTKNTYHNPFYTHVTYFVSRDDELMRIESKKTLKTSNVTSSLDESFVDIVDEKIKKFTVMETENKQTYMFYIEYENGHYLYFPIKNSL